MGLYADGSTIGIKNPTKLEAHNGGLMFYNYASNNPTNPSGRLNLTGNVEGDIKSEEQLSILKEQLQIQLLSLIKCLIMGRHQVQEN